MGQLRFPQVFRTTHCGHTSQSRCARQLPSRGALCGAFPQAFCKSPLHYGRPMAAPTILCTKKSDLQKASRIFLCWRYLSSRAVTRKVLSAKVSLTSVFGMGTGGPSPQSTPTASSSRQISYPSLRRKRQSSVIPLSLLSKSQTLRWFAILSIRMYPEN